MAKHKGKSATLYQFDVNGNQIGTFTGRHSAADALNLNTRALDAAIPRRSFIKQKYYLSYSPNFTPPPAGVYNRNPILRPGKDWLGSEYEDEDDT